MSQLYGLFYKTLSRDEYTGFCEFDVTPTMSTEYAVDGLVRCHGQIGFYTKNMPIYMEGDFDGSRFNVVKDEIPKNREEDVIRVLEYAVPELTEVQKKAIAKAADNDLFAFIVKPTTPSILSDILKRSSKCELLKEKMLRKISAMKEKEEMTKCLLSFGISLDRIELFHHREISMAQLKKNAYLPCLFADVPIEKAELIAGRLSDLKPYSIARLIGYTYHAILSITRNGDTCCTPEDLCRYINYKLNKSDYPVDMNMGLLNLCLHEMTNYVSLHVVNGKVYVYLNHVWDEENTVIRHVKRLQKNQIEIISEPNIDEIEKDLNIQYNGGQKNTFQLLKKSGIKILTGPPGAGKTAVIRGLISCYRKNGRKNVQLAATTGCAAQVMSEACGEPAETVNIMLNIRPYNDDVCGRNLNNPLEADFIVVDEISMCGLKMLSLLLQAVKSGSILLLVGDKDQLQSVEYGNILKDLIQSGVVEIYSLTEVMRQSGTIPENAKLINEGIEMLTFDDSFRLFQCKDESNLKGKLMRNYKPGISQILSPIKKGESGIWALNLMIQDSKGYSLASAYCYGKQKYYVGDKIIMTKTDYEKGFYNGDIGIIKDIKENVIIIQLQHQIISLCRQDLYYMSLAYAITIHKSQGSECEEIHVVLPDCALNMLTRRIFYTAVTRAKKRVYIYSVNNAYLTAINNTYERNRRTLLASRLKREMGDGNTRNS